MRVVLLLLWSGPEVVVTMIVHRDGHESHLVALLPLPTKAHHRLRL